MPSVVLLGGAGLVGLPAAHRLAELGWDVTVTGRRANQLDDSDVRYVRSDRRNAAELAQVVAADVVVDCVCWTAEDARLLAAHAGDVGSVVLVSSKAVYVDDQGRHSNSDEPPDFGGPVAESQPTLPPTDAEPDSREGYGAHKAAAERVLLDSTAPTSVLRPSRIHGVGAARSREWVFVRRVLDGRRHVLLAGAGRGANHPTAAVNLAELIAFCAQRPGDRVLNSADPDAPDGLAIARAVAAHLGHDWTEVLLDDEAPAGLGDHPWDTRPPFLLDTSAATELGFEPVGEYTDTVRPALDQLVRDGAPADDAYFDRFFDYAAEDAYLTGRSASGSRGG